MANSHPIVDRIAEIYRTESRRVLATLIRLLRDFDRAEEALHEAFRIALESWPRDGVPRNPRAWLVSTGRFRGIDAIRRRERGRELEIEAVGDGTGIESPEWDGAAVEDDQLRLIFTCCHPVLSVDARIALALREVCGLTTGEIACAYLVSDEAMKRRISRAKAVIRERRIPYEIPSRDEFEKRLGSVLHVIYLVYHEGYAASRGEVLVRRELTSEAVFLGPPRRRPRPSPRSAGSSRSASLPRVEKRRASRLPGRARPTGRSGSIALGPYAHRRGTGVFAALDCTQRGPTLPDGWVTSIKPSTPIAAPLSLRCRDRSVGTCSGGWRKFSHNCAQAVPFCARRSTIVKHGGRGGRRSDAAPRGGEYAVFYLFRVGRG